MIEAAKTHNLKRQLSLQLFCAFKNKILCVANHEPMDSQNCTELTRSNKVKFDLLVCESKDIARAIIVSSKLLASTLSAGNSSPQRILSI
ncbi:hypothetical protein MXB_1435 [Myxobolus squamalis]|nr:hypothetical protein MXB_1435 [Myxobolus squamalis]